VIHVLSICDGLCGVAPGATLPLWLKTFAILSSVKTLLEVMRSIGDPGRVLQTPLTRTQT